MKFKHKVKELEVIGECSLVLYHYNYLNLDTVPKDWENVELFDKDGNKLWTVNGMQNFKYWQGSMDCFVGINVRADRVELITFSGNAFNLNMETGEVTYYAFYK
jgi:hypothetical protein